MVHFYVHRLAKASIEVINYLEAITKDRLFSLLTTGVGYDVIQTFFPF